MAPNLIPPLPDGYFAVPDPDNSAGAHLEYGTIDAGGDTEGTSMASRALRPYQVEAIDAIATALANGGSGQLRAACGSGKTLIAMRAAERLVESDGLVIVLAPSLALVAQILRNWRDDSTIGFRRFAVCSDGAVGSGDDAMHVADLDVPVSTDRDDIAKMIASEGPRLIVGTYLSAGRLADAAREANVEIDFLACDEAHHLAGNSDAHTRRVMDPAVMPARRRLYMTGTPRIGGGRDDEQHDTRTLSMDDESVFGPVLYSYAFSRGIAEGYLADYRIAVIGVTDQEVRDLLNREDVEYADGIGLNTAAAQVALARAYRDFGLRRAITFHATIDDAQRFSATLPSTLATLPDASGSPAPTSLHVNGGMDGARRRQVLDALRTPPEGGWSVVSNVRCLSEGVDVPALDGVLFGNPKKSTVDIVQAASRALRPHPDTPGLSTIIVPVVIPDAGDEVESIDPGAYEALFQILRALKDHDDILAAGLNAARVKLPVASAGPSVGVNPGSDDDWEDLAALGELFPSGSDALDGGVSEPNSPAKAPGGQPGSRISKIEFHGISPKFLAELRLVVLRRTTSKWWERYAEACTYYRKNGHLDVPTAYTVDGFALGSWIASNRQLFRVGALSASCREGLDAIGMIWNTYETRWERAYGLATAFKGRHGHLDVPYRYVHEGFALGAWLNTQRQEYKRNTLSSERAEALEALGILWEPAVLDLKWQKGYEAARDYQLKHGSLNVPTRAVFNGYRLGVWASIQRRKCKSGTLPAAQKEQLDQLGMIWDALDHLWELGFSAACTFHAEHGHLRVPPGCDVNGLRLDTWIMVRRRELRSGKMPTERKRALDELGMVWDATSARWEQAYRAAVDFRKEYGHLLVPKGLCFNGVALGNWICTRRRELKAGTLSAERKRALDEIGMDWNPPVGGNRK